MDKSGDLYLPLSSLRLLVPPLRLMSACMWQVAQERNVHQYDKLAEFIMLVTEMVPELLNYKQKTQLILGLKARLIFELLKRMDNVDCETIRDHLNSFQQRTTNCTHEEDPDGEVEISKSAFVELVQTLIRDQSEKETFFKEVFSVLYGAGFDTALQILVWEFFYRLEEFLPVPSFSQVIFRAFSMLDVSSLDDEFKQFVSDTEDLKRILQHQQERQKLTKSEFTFMSDTILSTLASKQTTVASKDYVDQKMDWGEGKQDTEEQKTLKQENSWSEEDICEDDEETCNSSTGPNFVLHEYGLSPLTSSPCSDEAETAGEDTFQLVEEVKEHLDLRRNKEPSEEIMIQSVTGSRADVPLPLSEDSVRVSGNTCLECSKTFASRSTLKQHLRHVHTSARPFKCTQCDKTYKRRRDLNRHFLVHTSAQPFKCTECDKTYKSRKDLSFHFRTHSNPKDLSCSFCDKKFSSKASLNVHLRYHSGERPFACSLCDKRFMKKFILKVHMRIHTGERPYACTFCEKRFTQSNMLTVHHRIHKNEKPYLCSTCGKSFCSSGVLLVHSRKHTGERPHLCDLCGKGFSASTQLTRHRRYHTGERPYSCSQCDKSFHLSYGLKKHMMTHTGEKPYQCLTCHKTFSRKCNMRIHLKVHKNL